MGLLQLSAVAGLRVLRVPSELQGVILAPALASRQDLPSQAPLLGLGASEQLVSVLVLAWVVALDQTL
jgi:hypothetical protein